MCVTAKHVVKGAIGEQIFIMPDDDTRYCLPIDSQYEIRKHGGEDEEYKDIVVYRLDIDRFRSTATDFNLWRLEGSVSTPDALAEALHLMYVGYPSERSDFDYSNRSAFHMRVVATGSYIGAASAAHCHDGSVEDAIGLTSLDGFSGGAVLAAYETDVGRSPHFAGIIIRGTVPGGVTFIGAHVLINLANKICRQD